MPNPNPERTSQAHYNTNIQVAVKIKRFVRRLSECILLQTGVQDESLNGPSWAFLSPCPFQPEETVGDKCC